MSLFHSAFDTGAPASGSSKSLSNPFSTGAGHKRKRPSTTNPNAGDKNDQLRSTQANLEKLMARIEKGGVKEKEEGREGMGYGAQKKKKKQNHGGEDGDVRASAPAMTPKREAAKGKDGKRGQNQNQNQNKDQNKKQKSKVEPKGTSAKPSTPVSNHNQKKTDRSHPAPVELPFASPSLLKEVNGKKVGGEGNLTDMQKGMQAKLEGARFRWINEQLYSTPSTEAVAMMKKDPKIFADYHMTHRVLTSAWPSPPLDHIISLLSPLPARTLIVDLGCGDAGLARALVPQGKVVLSYDLVGDSGVPGSSTPEDKAADDEERGKSKGEGKEGWVVEADFLERVPLPGRPGGITSTAEAEAGTETQKEGGNKSNKVAKGKGKGKGKPDGTAAEVVDVVVCCLSLMGINWVGGIYEACRILKQGGTFHIAEVTSRFTSTAEFAAIVQSFGFALEEETSPSTHFTLFRFTKTCPVPQGPSRGEPGWNQRVKAGQEVLRACVYKKR